MHAAEGVVGRRPDLHPGGVRREDRAADVVGADEGDDAALDDRDRLPPVPDIFPDQRAGGLVVLGDPPAFGVEDGVDGDSGGGGEGADRLAAHRVIAVGGLEDGVDPKLGHPAGGVVGVGVGPARPRLGDHVPGGVIGVAARAAGVIGVGERAIGAGRARQAFAGGGRVFNLRGLAADIRASFRLPSVSTRGEMKMR